jgi:GNAT superfamily N-acetyltransferase
MTERFPTRVWYLAMDDPEQLRPAREREDVTVAHAAVPLGSLNRWLYREIGHGHHWLDRAAWDAARWQQHAESVETWLAAVRGTPAGLSELRRTDAATIEIHVFGILAPFQGQGAGGVLLTAAIRRGWALGASRVTVNTCELDGPHALDHYRARGFRVVREAVEQRARTPRSAGACGGG